MIYLATPYSDPDKNVQEKRFEQACKVAGELMRRGVNVFSPIAHTHPIAQHCELPTGWEFWEQYDRQHIGLCSEVLVVKMAGWEQSKGVQAEIKIAKSLGIPINFMENPF